MKTVRLFLELYHFSFVKTVVYMLQTSEYQIEPYLKWLWRTQDFGKVMYRRRLDATRRAKLLLLALGACTYGTMAVGAAAAGFGAGNSSALLFFGLAIIVVAPLLWAHLIALPLLLARWLIVMPEERRAIASSRQVFSNFQGPKIAIAGSYGKTTMKEILATVLSEGKNVAATPGNKNVTVSHARFAGSLTGKEDILLIEYGEGKPGDVAGFASYTRPTHAVITGLAPAHLDKYKTLKAAGEDIFAVADYLKGKNVFVNGESSEVKNFMKSSHEFYDHSGALGWKVKHVNLEITGMEFSLQKGSRKLHLKTGLIGEHLLGPLALAAGLAQELGLSDEQIISGVAKTRPFEHRMQPYQLAGGWVIDDSYNGNLEGIRAGTNLLKKLSAKRKIYVTPGLVDQGEETERVHLEMGRLIAAAQPDEVVLMQNSVSDFIKLGLEAGNFSGKLTIKQKPLEFYQNLEHIIAAGDLIMLQNDWPDNYT